MRKVSKTGWVIFPPFSFFFFCCCSAAAWMKSPPSRLTFFHVLRLQVMWEIFSLFLLTPTPSLPSSLESFLEGSFVLTLQSVQFSSSQVSIREKETAFVLGWSPLTEERSFYRGNWICLKVKQELYWIFLLHVNVSVHHLLDIQVILNSNKETQCL